MGRAGKEARDKKKHMVRGVETPRPNDLLGVASRISRDIITEFTPQGKKMRAQGTQDMKNVKRAFTDSIKKKEGLKTAYKKHLKVKRAAYNLNEPGGK